MEIREYNDKYFQEIADLFEQQLKIELLIKNENLKKLLINFFIYDALANENYIRVAIIDNKVAGFLIANLTANKKKNDNYAKLANKDLKKFILNLIINLKEIYNLIKFMFAFKNSSIDFKKNEKVYDGELNFFAVSNTYVGLGIGKALYLDMIDFFKKEKAKKIFLFTNSELSYNFYEKNNWTMAASYESSKDLKWMVYDKEI